MGDEKLVRDRIPQIIRAAGKRPIVRIAQPAEYRRLLRAKLVEEVEEFLADEDPTELADVLEVLHALAAEAGLGPDGLERLRARRAAERGAFTERIVWAGNEPDHR